MALLSRVPRLLTARVTLRTIHPESPRRRAPSSPESRASDDDARGHDDDDDDRDARARGDDLDHLDDGEWLTETLGTMGVVHARDYQVTAEMYPMVGECLVAALSEAAGETWTPAHAEAWGEAFGAVSSLMLAGAEQAQAQ